MSPGKIASQTGHAFVGAALVCQQARPELVGRYLSDPPGTKVVLKATLRQIQRLLFELDQAKLPFFVTIDSGCPEFFGGQPILTSVGFGPAATGELPPWVRKLQLL